MTINISARKKKLKRQRIIEESTEGAWEAINFFWESGFPSACGVGTHAEPFPTNKIRLAGRFGEYYIKQRKIAKAIVRLLWAVPESLWLLRGLDVASDELSIPNWVMVPIFRYVERQSAVVSALHRGKAGPPLKLTAHIGEDFRHIMEGLRRIYECV